MANRQLRVAQPRRRQRLAGDDVQLGGKPADAGRHLVLKPCRLRLFSPGAAPAFGGHLLAWKQWAGTSGVCCFALEQGAICTMLACGVFGELHFIRFGGVLFVAQRNGLWVGFLQHGWGLRIGQMSGGQSACANGGLEHKNSAI